MGTFHVPAAIYYPSSCPSPAKGEGTRSLAPRPTGERLAVNCSCITCISAIHGVG